MLTHFHKIFDAFTNNERQLFQSAALVFSVSLVLNGANIFYETTTLTPVEGGSYTEGLIGQPIAINPLIAGTNEVDQDLVEFLFSDLIDLSEKYETSENGRLWTITLKEDLLWSDGTPLTSSDVIFTLESIKNPETRSSLFATWQGVTAKRISEREIEFNLKTPYVFFLDNLESFKVAPQHIFGAIPTANLRLSEYNFEPVGSGPYQFVSFEKRKDGFISEYTLTTNNNYYDEAPLIKDFNFKFFQNYEEAITAFNKREIDGLGGISSNDIPNLKIGHAIREIHIPRYYAIFFNPSTALPLREDAVREALELATDRDLIVNKALRKHGIPIYGPIYPGIEGYDADLSENKDVSLEDAKKLLDQARWIPGKDGIRTKEGNNGELVLAFEIVIPDIDFLIEAIELIQSDWEKIGVSLTPVILSPSEIANDTIKSRNYELLVFGNILKNNPDVFSFWHSSERFRPGLNLALYENKTVDTLLESIRQDFDYESRIVDLKKLQIIIEDDKPAIFLFSPHYLYAGPKDLGGFDTSLLSSPSNRYDNVATWYLKTARVFR